MTIKSYIANNTNINEFNVSKFSNYIYESQYLFSKIYVTEIYNKVIGQTIANIFNIDIHDNFINLSFKYSEIDQICEFYLHRPQCKERIIIDFIGTNFGKRMHFGHLRSIIIGSMLTNIFDYYGANVETDSHFGDYGINLAIFIYYQREFKDLQYLSLDEITNIYKQHKNIIKNNKQLEIEKYTKELIAFVNKEEVAINTYKILSILNSEYITKVIKLFKITITFWNGESDYIDKINQITNNYTFINKCIIETDLCGRLVTNNSIVLTRSDSTPLYAFTDLAALIDRIEKKYDQIFYLVDKRQSFHFEKIKEFIDINFIHNSVIKHLKFGFVYSSDNIILTSRGSQYNCIIKVVEIKAKKYNTSVQNVRLAIVLYELRHDIATDYIYTDHIIDKNINDVIVFSKQINKIYLSVACCDNFQNCICLSIEEKDIIKNICIIYEQSIKVINKLNVHLLYKPLSAVIIGINKYKKEKPSIIFVIAIQKLLKNLLNSFFNYNVDYN